MGGVGREGPVKTKAVHFCNTIKYQYSMYIVHCNVHCTRFSFNKKIGFFFFRVVSTVVDAIRDILKNEKRYNTL